LQKTCGWSAQKLVDLAMPKTRARCYSIEVKDPKGSLLFSTLAYWDDKDKRIALAQITRPADSLT
jgi:hypothetical protein